MSSTAFPENVPASSQRKLLAWLPTFVWLCVLVAFSTDLFSADHTGSVLRRIVHVLYGPVSEETLQHIHFLIRKTAHFCSYGLLSALAFRSWRVTLPKATPWNLRWTNLALLLTLLVASLDEFHQTFIPSRTGMFRDVVLDMTGALFFQLAILIWLNRKRA